jgi:hypothetical protein
MKKIVFLSILAIVASHAAQAQIKPDFEKSKGKLIKQPQPLPVNKTTNPVSAPVAVYSLTSVRVRIRTGNDNKEFPSQVYAMLRTKNTPEGQGHPFSQTKLGNEMRINSDTEFGLERQSQLQVDAKLDAFQSQGLVFAIRYRPNFFADAWKIENITLVLEFKDQNGNLHPTLGNKTIQFSNAYGFLNNEYQIMECITDGSFAPLTAVIKK